MQFIDDTMKFITIKIQPEDPGFHHLFLVSKVFGVFSAVKSIMIELSFSFQVRKAIHSHARRAEDAFMLE